MKRTKEIAREQAGDCEGAVPVSDRLGKHTPPKSHLQSACGPDPMSP